MPPTPSRASISSLKATKTAHRMASAIQNPPIDLPKPAGDVTRQAELLPSETPDLRPMHLSLPPIDWRPKPVEYQPPPFVWVDDEDEPDLAEPDAVAPPATARQSKRTFEEQISRLANRWLFFAAIVLAAALTIASLTYVVTHL